MLDVFTELFEIIKEEPCISTCTMIRLNELKEKIHTHGTMVWIPNLSHPAENVMGKGVYGLEHGKGGPS